MYGSATYISFVFKSSGIILQNGWNLTPIPKLEKYPIVQSVLQCIKVNQTLKHKNAERRWTTVFAQ